MGDIASIDATVAQHPDAIAFLSGQHKPGEQGGSGVVFDWARIPPACPAR